jgi:hypothetical protein
MSQSCYDVIIVGAGLSGLRVGIEVLSKHPQLRCCIIEKYGYNGGRIFTYRKKIKGVGDVQWEHGAGRISTSHKKVLSLLKKYSLTFLPISGETMWLEKGLTKNDFSALIDVYITPLLSLPSSMLQSHTLSELLHMIHGKDISSFYLQFPYYAEIHTIRADLALQSFHEEMKSNSGFGVCQEGLSSLTDHMAEEFIKCGGTIIQKTELCSVSYSDSFSLECFDSCTNKKRFFKSSVCVLALHHQALTHIKGAQHFSVLKKLVMEPLLRVYAIFPVIRKRSWFSDLSKIVTPGHIRYIIPIDPSRGIIMISYTDGKDAKYWMKQSSHTQSNIMKLIRDLFPDRSIPDPIFFKLAPWEAGCTYWLPGDYNVQEESQNSLQPDKKIPLFMCGESFAVHQVWMESALEQADCLLQCDSFQSSLHHIQ